MKTRKLPFRVHWVRGVVTAVLFAVMCVVSRSSTVSGREGTPVASWHAFRAPSGEPAVLNPRFCMATPVDLSTQKGTGALKYSEIIFKLSLEHKTNQLSLFGNFFIFFGNSSNWPLTIFAASLETDLSLRQHLGCKQSHRFGLIITRNGVSWSVNTGLHLDFTLKTYTDSKRMCMAR